MSGKLVRNSRTLLGTSCNDLVEDWSLSHLLWCWRSHATHRSLSRHFAIETHCSLQTPPEDPQLLSRRIPIACQCACQATVPTSCNRQETTFVSKEIKLIIYKERDGRSASVVLNTVEVGLCFISSAMWWFISAAGTIKTKSRSAKHLFHLLRTIGTPEPGDLRDLIGSYRISGMKLISCQKWSNKQNMVWQVCQVLAGNYFHTEKMGRGGQWINFEGFL